MCSSFTAVAGKIGCILTYWISFIFLHHNSFNVSECRSMTVYISWMHFRKTFRCVCVCFSAQACWPSPTSSTFSIVTSSLLWWAARLLVCRRLTCMRWSGGAACFRCFRCFFLVCLQVQIYELEEHKIETWRGTCSTPEPPPPLPCVEQEVCCGVVF